MQSEKLMRVHLWIFGSYLVGYLLFILNSSIEAFTNPIEQDQTQEPSVSKPRNVQNYCRSEILNNFFMALIQISNLALIILFIYLSVNFSTPLSEEYRTKFLLLFQKRGLDDIKQAVEEQQLLQFHEARVKKYNETAIRNADLIIIRALTLTQTDDQEQMQCTD